MVVAGGNGRGFFFGKRVVGRLSGYLALEFTYFKYLLKTVYHDSSLH